MCLRRSPVHTCGCKEMSTYQYCILSKNNRPCQKYSLPQPLRDTCANCLSSASASTSSMPSRPAPTAPGAPAPQPQWTLPTIDDSTVVTLDKVSQLDPLMDSPTAERERRMSMKAQPQAVTQLDTESKTQTQTQRPKQRLYLTHRAWDRAHAVDKRLHKRIPINRSPSDLRDERGPLLREIRGLRRSGRPRKLTWKRAEQLKAMSGGRSNVRATSQSIAGSVAGSSTGSDLSRYPKSSPELSADMDGETAERMRAVFEQRRVLGRVGR